jgi:Carboxypeptidase regulatory-like domain
MRANTGSLMLLLLSLSVSACAVWAAGNGSLSGILTDPSGAVVPGATITLVNTALKAEFRATSNGQGFYAFPSLPVGRYDLTIEADGFKTQKKTSLGLGQRSETVTVVGTAATTEAQVDTVSTHSGELVTGSQMTALPLNGRSYTDLLPIQPGVVPVTTLQPNSVIMAGVTGGLSPSGDLNPGNLSIGGQRESSNGFMVNGIDVQEHMNGGTSIPTTISPSKGHNFAPRLGLAYALRLEGGILRKIFGGGGKSSIRASYGIFYTAFPGLSAGVMYAVPPFGYNYLSPEPPLFARLLSMRKTEPRISIHSH